MNDDTPEQKQEQARVRALVEQSRAERGIKPMSPEQVAAYRERRKRGSRV